jgi:hypothetical protein
VLTGTGELPPTANAQTSPTTLREASGSWTVTESMLDPRVFQATPNLFWTGNRVAVLYGVSSAGDGMYIEFLDPGSGTTRAASKSILDWRAGHAAVWTGSEILVWGGDSGPGIRQGGAAYSPSTDTWRPLPAASAVPTTVWDVAVWTGTEMVVWGNEDASGFAYSTAENRWRAIAATPLSPRLRPAFVWTGNALIIWGGCDWRIHPQCDDRLTGADELSDGAAYNPQTDSWRARAPSPLSRRDAPQAVWTGREMIVWGGEAPSAAAGAYGAAYDPRTDTWRTIPAGPLSPRARHTPVWTGTEMIVWGGSQGAIPLGDGAVYRPSDNTWRMLPPAPTPARDRHGSVWTGKEMVIAGGHPAGPLIAYRPD